MRKILFFILLSVVVLNLKEGVAMSAPEGIDKEEAISIAKKFMIEQNLENDYFVSKYFKVKNEVWYRCASGSLVWSKPEKGAVYTEEKMWQVIFAPKTKGLTLSHHLSVLVNQKTGKVEDHWYNKW